MKHLDLEIIPKGNKEDFPFILEKVNQLPKEFFEKAKGFENEGTPKIIARKYNEEGDIELDFVGGIIDINLPCLNPYTKMRIYDGEIIPEFHYKETNYLLSAR